jgi:hypothetical protein
LLEENMPHVIIVYDLHGATSTEYSKLDTELKNRKYTKISEDTTWEGIYKDDVTPEGAIRTTKNEFAAAAQAAGVSKYDLKIYCATKMLTDSLSKA